MCMLERVDESTIGHDNSGQWAHARLPDLKIPEATLPWKKAMMLSRWQEMVKLIATSGHQNYAMYVTWAINEASAKVVKNQALIYRVGDVTQAPQKLVEYDRTLVLSLPKHCLEKTTQ